MTRPLHHRPHLAIAVVTLSSESYTLRVGQVESSSSILGKLRWASSREDDRGDQGQGGPAHGHDSCWGHRRGRHGGEFGRGRRAAQCSAVSTVRVRVREPEREDRLSGVPYAAAASVLPLWRESVALGGLGGADGVSLGIPDSDSDTHANANAYADSHSDGHHHGHRDSHHDAYQLTIAPR